VLAAFDQGGLNAAMESYRQARRREKATRPYQVSPGRLPADKLKARVDATIADGFTWEGREAFPLQAPIDWAADPYHDRSWRFSLNAWLPLGDVLVAHATTGNSTYLRFAVELACDWLRQNPVTGGSNPFAWYDMAVGLRALQLAYLVDAAARDATTDPETLSTLLAGAWVHGWQLAQPRNFNAYTNHGIYQAAGLLALGRSLPELRDADEWERIGAERLRLMFKKSYSSDGVHLEHSPGYHSQMTRLLIAITESGLSSDPELLAIRGRAERALAWMIAPDGSMPAVGDTDATVLQSAQIGASLSTVDPELAFGVTRGAVGSPPGESFRVFPEGGYAIFRDSWKSRGTEWAQGSYLMFAGGFHSRTHKHADDLSFVWYDAGRWLLVDAGRYGYYYDDPARIYCESTRAHNTVEIDGSDYSRRALNAYGSALTEWGDRSGLPYVSATVQRRWPPVVQRRTLVFDPGRWVVAVDELEAPTSHSYEQWFHFAPDLNLAVEGTTASAQLSDRSSLYVVPLVAGAVKAEAVRGEEQPRLQGWYSPGHRALEPNWALGYKADVTTAVFATVLCLSSTRPEVDFGVNTVSPDAIKLQWRADGRTDGFTLDRSAAIPRAEAGSARRPHAR